MIEKLQEKFNSPEHAGPRDVVKFLEIGDVEEAEIVQRDVYEQVHLLISGIRQKE